MGRRLSNLITSTLLRLLAGPLHHMVSNPVTPLSLTNNSNSSTADTTRQPTVVGTPKAPSPVATPANPRMLAILLSRVATTPTTECHEEWTVPWPDRSVTWHGAAFCAFHVQEGASCYSLHWFVRLGGLLDKPETEASQKLYRLASGA